MLHTVDRSAVDPHHFDVDLDSTHHPDADPDADPDGDPESIYHPDVDPDADPSFK